MDDITIAVVLDKSGSMQSIWGDSIGGLNAFVAAQAAEPGSAKLSLTLFDTNVQVAHGPIPLTEVVSLGPSTYVPGGNTALYDAIGTTIEAIQTSSKSGENVLMVIITDGQENSSSAYTRSSLAALIDAKKGSGWEFLYLGTSPENWQDAKALGTLHHNFQADAVGITAAFLAVDDHARGFRSRRSGKP